MPFRGCLRKCIYCNQVLITGRNEMEELSPETVSRELMRHSDAIELCFFGGSFARQRIEKIKSYLDAIRYAPPGSEITFSSYPGDFEGPRGKELIDLLSGYPIGTIELGVPSLDSRVFRICGRDDEPERIKNSISFLRNEGIHIGVQIMIGLPGQTFESVLSDLDVLGGLMEGAPSWHLRIYPCLVLRDTKLASLYRHGEFTPLDLEAAVKQTGALLHRAERLGFTVIRVGLPESVSLRESVLAGPYHPSFGELALSEKLVTHLVSDAPRGPWHIDSRQISHLTGHGGYGIKRLAVLSLMTVDDVKSLVKMG